jgi:hypothetical protein
VEENDAKEIADADRALKEIEAQLQRLHDHPVVMQPEPEFTETPTFDKLWNKSFH